MENMAPCVPQFKEFNGQLHRGKQTVQEINDGNWFAVDFDVANEAYGNNGGETRTFTTMRTLRLVDMSHNTTREYIQTHGGDLSAHAIFERYIDSGNITPVGVGNVQRIPFADMDGTAVDMKALLDRMVIPDCDGWYVPAGQFWPPASRNAGTEFHEEVMLLSPGDVLIGFPAV